MENVLAEFIRDDTIQTFSHLFAIPETIRREFFYQRKRNFQHGNSGISSDPYPGFGLRSKSLPQINRGFLARSASFRRAADKIRITIRTIQKTMKYAFGRPTL